MRVINKIGEWSCNEGVDGFANKYELDTADLRILNLSSEEYTILHWLALDDSYFSFARAFICEILLERK